MLKVKQRQLNLKTYYNFYKGNIDGIEGNQTKESYKNFQRKEKLVVDGIYGEITNNKLIEVIKNIQLKLNSKNYSLQIDGIVGDKTIKAIKDFQKKENLVEDGIINDNLLMKLENTNDDWRNIKHFKKSEFSCKDNCGLNNINISLINILENIRNHFNKPIIITSGCRCYRHNILVGGVSNSKHLYGKAADFVVKGVPTYKVLNYCNKLKKEGLIRYCYSQTSFMKNAVHIDIN